ncbi:tyrosine-type recombinase/integrase [Rhizobium rhizoryzae]|uniref:Integrase n=1 Tax=Rhizobium rhizoryzae TaxID=451876 RepID=A0A7W6LKE2_9HYPH|nr:tyrosine-type recombinase/integrase [Rhizobium rhizoryzae]MBB4146000.1 integrase [Rhizobium rhizoryzae]
MRTLSNSQPTLADVREALHSNRSIPDTRRRRIDNALNSVWRWSGLSLKEIPATMPALRQVMKGIEPAAHGVERPTITNARNLVMHAMKESGVVPELESYCSPNRSLSPAWAIVSARLATKHERVSIVPFLRYCSDQGIVPKAVADEHFQAFITHKDQTSFRDNQHTAVRNTAVCWNKLRRRYPDLQLQELTPPASKLRRLKYAVSDFPLSFQQSVQAYRSWMQGDDLLADNARLTIVADNTLENYLRRIHRAGNILAEALGSPEQIKDLETFVAPANFKHMIAGLHARDNSAQKSETFQTTLLFIQIARDWLQCDADHLAALEAFRKRLRQPKMAMTEKNKKLVSQFDDPAVLKRLLNAPKAIWSDMKLKVHFSNRFKLAQAQAAIGLGILTYMPIRLKNLSTLKFGENIILRAGGRSSLIIPADATKAGRSIEFDIPSDLAEMIIEFHDHIALSAFGKHPVWLFSRTDGDAKGFAQVRELIQTYFKQRVGFHMNPHAFRHLCAKLILDANPGAHTLVQELLGHKSIETSTAFYAGLDSRRAGRHHAELIRTELAREATQPRRRRQLKEC